MQSVVKLSEGSNVYRLSDLANSDQETGSDHPADGPKKPAAAMPSNKEGAASGGAKSAEEPHADKGAARESAPLSSSAADDALAWLKIIQTATADLTADIRPSKTDAPDRADADEDAPFAYNAASPSAKSGERRNPGLYDHVLHEDYSDERKLAQRLSYRNAEPLQAPPQTLGAAVMPYVAATGIIAFLAGSAAVYFLTGSPSADSKAKAVAPAPEIHGDAPFARGDQAGSKKGGLQRGAPASVPSDGPAYPGSQAEEQGGKAAQPGGPADRQPQAWSDTVETFKQFMRPERK